MDLHDDIRSRPPIQFLTPTDRAYLECRYQTEFHEGYCEIRISNNNNNNNNNTDGCISGDETKIMF